MGFSDLALVAPSDPKVLNRHKVIQRASGAKDVLQRAKIYTTLEEAVQDRNVICGTGMPFDMYQTRTKREYVEPRIYFDALLSGESKMKDEARLALVFGSEQRGMISSQCHLW